MVAIRALADRGDFALANILSFLLILAAWLLLIAGLKLSYLPRFLWKLGLILPASAMLIWVAIFKIERFDGDLIPIFRPRWAAPSKLPQLANGEQDPESILAPRDTDYPEFLGLHRDATLPSTHIDPQWDVSPPQIAWKQDIGDGWSGFAIQGDVAVTMEQRGQEEWVTAYYVVDGSLLWNYVIKSRHTNIMGGTGPRSTPTIVGEHVFICSAVSRVACLELATGNELWSQELLELANTSQADFEQEVAWGRSASPLVIDGQVIVPLGGIGNRRAALIAFDQTNGSELWRGGDDQISYSSPMFAILRGIPQILYTSESRLAAYNLEQGEVLWSFDWPGSSSSSATVSQPVVVDDAYVLLSKGYSQGAALLHVSSQDGDWKTTAVWRNESSLKTKFTTAVVHNGYAYGLSDGILECVDLHTGKREWKQGRYRQGQVLLVGEHLLITSEAGEIVLVKASPNQWDELASLPVIGDVSWNTAALSGDRLLMRNSEQAACVILPLIQSPMESTSGIDLSGPDLSAPDLGGPAPIERQSL
jgi:outer membrane protein assembly factor BamB